MPRFTDKTVIITGAAGALGVGMVRRFAAEDARVVVGARQREQVADLLDELIISRPGWEPGSGCAPGAGAAENMRRVSGP
ncbi:SDR family NAD(P)-dependent oxidoreductase [Streptomyces olivochromogenes]|uniref:SDR family NAD(P)-dependent oxidoreductase n=1 Tax=Streptomyces olivochromogenes TaxID=1963 RepID=UPI003687AC6B